MHLDISNIRMCCQEVWFSALRFLASQDLWCFDIVSFHWLLSEACVWLGNCLPACGLINSFTEHFFADSYLFVYCVFPTFLQEVIKMALLSSFACLRFFFIRLKFIFKHALGFGLLMHFSYMGCYYHLWPKTVTEMDLEKEFLSVLGEGKATHSSMNCEGI